MRKTQLRFEIFLDFKSRQIRFVLLDSKIDIINAKLLEISDELFPSLFRFAMLMKSTTTKSVHT